MKDTVFYPNDDQKKRLATIYGKTDGKLTAYRTLSSACRRTRSTPSRPAGWCRRERTLPSSIA